MCQNTMSFTEIDCFRHFSSAPWVKRPQTPTNRVFFIFHATFSDLICAPAQCIPRNVCYPPIIHLMSKRAIPWKRGPFCLHGHNECIYLYALKIFLRPRETRERAELPLLLACVRVPTLMFPHPQFLLARHAVGRVVDVGWMFGIVLHLLPPSTLFDFQYKRCVTKYPKAFEMFNNSKNMQYFMYASYSNCILIASWLNWERVFPVKNLKFCIVTQRKSFNRTQPYFTEFVTWHAKWAIISGGYQDTFVLLCSRFTYIQGYLIVVSKCLGYFPHLCGFWAEQCPAGPYLLMNV